MLKLIAFRVDASAEIGLGHVKRCLSLAYALRQCGVTAIFVTRDLGIDVAEQVKANGFDCMTLPPPGKRSKVMDSEVPHSHWARVDWKTDTEQTIGVLTNSSTPDCVVVDHYGFDAKWHKAVSEQLTSRIAVIDDLADRRIAADVLIDPNYAHDHRRKYDEHLCTQIPILGGPKYVLLGPTYATAPRYQFNAEVRSVGIFMGGADQHNFSVMALRACRIRAGFKGPLEILTTRANPNLCSLRAEITRWPQTTLTLDLPELSAFFGRHDLQIGAGGGATWERCCLGTPSLVLITAENQRVVVPDLARLGALTTLDAPGLPTVELIGDAVRTLLNSPALRHDQSNRARLLVDGLGAQRVALYMTASALSLRRATMNDAVVMHHWRTHSATRKVSLNSGNIAFEDHVCWLEQTLSDSRRCLLVGSVGRLDVGIIRFDNCEDTAAEVSLYVDPALHGLGLGTALLHAGESYFLATRMEDVRFLATVLPGNEASRRMFESAGYRFVGDLGEKTATLHSIREMAG